MTALGGKVGEGEGGSNSMRDHEVRHILVNTSGETEIERFMNVRLTSLS